MGDQDHSLVIPPGQGKPIWFLGTLIEFKAVSADTNSAYAVMVQTIPGGQRPAPLHLHREKDEGFYVLEGTLRIHIGEREVDAGAGTFVYIPRGVVHGFYNPTNETAKLLALFYPAGFEEFFQEVGEPAAAHTLPPTPAGPPDMARVGAIAKKYDTEMQGPPRNGTR